IGTLVPNVRLSPTLAWQMSGDESVPLDPRLLPLLAGIAAAGSLATAVADRGLSYRAGWGLLRDCQRTFGAPLVTAERGRGAKLAPLGERLLAADKAAQRRFASVFKQSAIDLRMPRPVRAATAPRLTIAASHDLAMAGLIEAVAAQGNLTVDLSF